MANNFKVAIIAPSATFATASISSGTISNAIYSSGSISGTTTNLGFISGGSANFTAASINGVAITSGGGSAASITIANQGTNLTTSVGYINFTGAGVTATGTSSVTVTIPGGSGGSSSPTYISASAGTVGGWNIAASSIFSGSINFTSTPTPKIYVGQGSWSSSNTPFYLDNSGSLSLGNKLEWNGSRLLIGDQTGTVGFQAPANPTTNDIAIYAGASALSGASAAAFRVTYGGVMYATGASVTGSITATSGNIGGWNISSSALSTGTTSGTFSGLGSISSSYPPFFAGANDAQGSSPNFYVNSNGVLNANAVNVAGFITGSVNITGGDSSGFHFNSTTIDARPTGAASALIGYGGLYSAPTNNLDVFIWSGSANASKSTAPFRVDYGGNLWANNATFNSAFVGNQPILTNKVTSVLNNILVVSTTPVSSSIATSNVSVGFNNLDTTSNAGAQNNVVIGGYLLKNMYNPSYNVLVSSTNPAPSGSSQGIQFSTGLGIFSLYNSTSGTYNTAAGYSSLYGNTNGIGNTGVGARSGFYNNTGNYNTFLGWQAGYSNMSATSGSLSGMVLIGTDSGGNGATATTNNQFVLGTSSHTYYLPGASAYLGVANNPIYTKSTAPYQPQTFYYTGVVAVYTSSSRFYNDTGGTRSITSVRASVGTAPTGSAMLIDVRKNGTSASNTIFTGSSISIPATTFTSGALTSFNSGSSLAAGDYLTVAISQVGSTVAGSDLTVQVNWS